jgi:hypothetical protein
MTLSRELGLLCIRRGLLIEKISDEFAVALSACCAAVIIARVRRTLFLISLRDI